MTDMIARQPQSLDAQLVVRRGDFLLDVTLCVKPGEVVALLGPNGSGKSTLLAALAGLLAPESATVTVSGRTLTSRTPTGRNPTSRTLTSRNPTGRDISVPPERRGIGLLGQEPLLFPHLNAEDNVAFGQQSQGVPRADALRQARDWLHAVGLEGYGRRKPGELSGGQQQRVAIARALAAKPDVLLLDEPMAALDVQTAVLIRQVLREQLAASGTTAILVTHDVLDAIVLADRVAILDNGRIIDDGPTARVLGQPRNRFIAALAGVNLVTGTAAADGSLQLEDGRVFTGTHTGTHPDAQESAAEPEVGAGLSAVFRPTAVSVQRMEQEGRDRFHASRRRPPVNQWEATVVGLEPSSGGIRIRTDDEAGIFAELAAARVAELALQPGHGIRLAVPASEVAIHVT